jgi:hypothetical protein
MRFFYYLERKYYDIKLFFKSKYQLLRYGFEFRDTWSLDYSCAKWLVPRLKHLRDNLHSTPIKPDGKMTETGPEAYTIEEWQKILDEMIFGFEFVLNKDKYLDECYPADFDFDFKTDEKGYIKWNDNRKPDFTKYNELSKKAEEGRVLFARNFESLWD